MRRLAVFPAVLVIAALLQTGHAPPAGAASSCAPGWHRVAKPPASTLVSVAAVTSDDAWAVGAMDNAQLHPIAVHWDGSSWNTADLPFSDGTLTSVTAIASDDVWAVGTTSSSPVALHWDGTTWSEIPTPSVGGGRFDGVSAMATDDVWAVGAQNGTSTGSTPLTEHWNGSSWTDVSTPAPAGDSELVAVDAESVSNAWAVGWNRGATLTTLAEHWDGRQWQLVPTPDGAGYAPSLLSVAVADQSDVWAVGSGGGQPSDKGTFSFAFAQRFDGAGSFQEQDVPHIPGASSEDSLNAVIARSTDDVWSAGAINGRPVSEHWDGSSWRVIPTHHVLLSLSSGSDGVLFGVGSRGDTSWAERLCSVPAPSPDMWAVAKPVVFSYPTPVGARGSFLDRFWNGGTETAQDVIVTDDMKPGFVPVSAWIGRGSCSIDRRKRLVRCDVGALEPGQMVKLRVGADLVGSKDGKATARLHVRTPSDPYRVNDTSAEVLYPAGPGCTIVGTEANDRLHGTPRGDVICGLGGNDRVFSDGGNDTLLGGTGNDVLLGGRGGDTIDGGPGWDRCAGGPGKDILESCSK